MHLPKLSGDFNAEISIPRGERYELHELRVIAVPRVRGQPVYFFLATPSFIARE